MSGAPQFDPSIGQKHIIERPRLLKLLDETEAKIILLVAPAGYGKTTLARQWAATRSPAWYRMTPASRDPAVLALALIDTLCTPGRQSRSRAAARLSASGAPAPSPGALAQLAMTDVEPLGVDWLVLDDLHTLDGAAAAQDFLSEMIDRLGVRLLITSRVRPTWATSRRVIYGEIFEVQMASLAMSEAEVIEVLGTRNATPSFLSRAAGWPAIVGLASASAVTNLPDTEVPQRLFDFLAHEVRAAASPELRAKLVTLGIIQRVAAGGVPELDVSGDLVTEALNLGIVVAVSPTTCEMHPLMREFLLARDPRDRDDVRSQSSSVFDFALTESDWETAAECVLLSRDPTLLGRLLDHELNPMMSAGRLETLRQWENLTRETGYEGAMAHLLRAEVAFCDGRYAESALEAGVAAEMADRPRHRVEALSKAGRAEYFADNNRGAIESYSLALDEADTPPSRAEALRGLVLASVALDEPDLDNYWERYVRLPPIDAADLLRRAATELHVAYYRGRLYEALESASQTQDLLRDVRDPMIRSGFHNTLAHTLVLAGRFREGEREARACRAELDEYGLEFGLIHININLARAAAGLKRYADATALLRETRVAHGSTPFTRLSCDAQLMRIVAIRGGERQPLPSSLPQTDVNLYAELLATHALYEAVRGDPLRVSTMCRQADELSHSEEVRVLSGWAKAVGCLALGVEPAASEARSAMRRSMTSGIVDSLVVAYRAAPQLLSLISASANDDERDFLVGVMTEADDDALCQAHHIARAENDAPLTPRELEVLQLVAAGLTNQEIASQLFITLSTAKAHVRHIMEKLNARSRTDAAMKGLALGAPHTASDTAEDTAASPRRPSR